MMICRKIVNYYSDKIQKSGCTPDGVDWNCRESQYLRFHKLSYLMSNSSDYTIVDYGCGYGELACYLEKSGHRFKYYGYDVSREMISAAKKYHKDSNCIFSNTIPCDQYDYVIASGIFNVKLDMDDNLWLSHINETLLEMNQMSVKGFAFNMLSLWSDKHKRSDHLYYSDPVYFFEYCMKQFSSKVSVLHDYPLYEFTIIVNKC